MYSNRLTPIFLTFVVLSLSILFSGCGQVPDGHPGTTPSTPVPSPTQPDATATPLPPDPTAPPSPSPTAPASPQPTAGPRCTDRASFVSDVTIPDNTVVTPGQSFVKTWRLRNTGTCTWTTDYALVFAHGDRLNGALSVPLPNTVSPNSTVDLSVTLTAPAGAGTYTGRWQLRSTDGTLFGLGEHANGTFLVRIVIAATPTPPPTPTAQPTVPPTVTPPPAGGGWRGEYYANRDLVGAPALVRQDALLDFNWGLGAPAAGLPNDSFSVRWTRVLFFKAGVYRFRVVVDDGVRLYLDNVLVIDAWTDGARREVTGNLSVGEGEHSLRLEYYDRAGEACIQATWDRLSAFPDWKGEYWTNPGLRGAPILVQNEGRIDFDWGLGSAAAGLPVDNWSARWTRTLLFEAGTYRFHILVDDGARLWLDNQLILDEWRDGTAREITADYSLSRGEHTLRAEFYEHSENAQMRLWWEKLPAPSYPHWKGEYWANMDLSGSPRIVRDEPSIDFDWGLGAPAAGLPADKFSARWERWVDFEAGVYLLYAQADNGIRVYLDGKLVIDAWYSNGQEVHMIDQALGGTHHLVVEYYDNGGAALARFWWNSVGGFITGSP